MSGPAAVDDDRVQPDVLEQDDVGRELLAQRLLAHRRAAVLDHHGAAVELADVGQRLEQRLDAGARGPFARGSCRVLRVEPDVVAGEVGEVDVRATRRHVPGARPARPRRPRRPDPRRRSGPARAPSIRSPASAMPAAWATRPQFGSRPVSAVCTSCEFAIARATRSASSAPTPPRSPRPGAIRVAPSPSATTSSASWSSAASSRPSGSGSPEAPLACSTTVSLVLIWPSTVIRSNERRPRRAGAASGSATSGVGLDEAEHRREARLDHPRALRLRRKRHPAGAQGAGLGPAVGGHDRPGERRPRRRRRAAARRRSIPPRTAVDRQRHTDHAGLRDGDRGGLDAERLGGGVAHRQGVAVAVLAGGGIGVARVGDDGAERAPRRNRRRRRAPGAAAAAFRVTSSAERTSSESHTSRPTSGSPDGLIPRAHAAARKPGASRGRVELARRRPGRRPSASAGSGPSVASPQPLRLARPSIRLRFCTACPAAPFQRLSIAQKATIRPDRSSRRDVDASGVRVAHVADAGGRLDDLDEGLRLRSGPRTARRAPRGSIVSARGDVTARQQPLVDREQVRDEAHRALVAEARAAPARSPGGGGGRRRRRA